MSDTTNERKLQHIRIIEQDRDTDRRKNYFESIRLTHRALPEISLADVDASTTVLGKKLSFPLLISSMTGGDHQVVESVNRHLAHAAESMGVALGVGSQRVMFTHPAARASFALRQWAPNALLFANLGAVQLNLGFTPAMCQEAVDVVGADALFLHLNPLQEAVQPEGDTQFAGLADRIAEVVQHVKVPVVIKEVGAGVSSADVELLIQAGVRYIDVSGSGGLSWSRIEQQRREEEEEGLGILFQDWGIPTPLALDLLEPYLDRVTLFASGGVRSGIDMMKAIVLGASLCGLASPFLKPAMESVERVSSEIIRYRDQFCTAMFLLGARSIDQVYRRRELILPS